VVVFLVALRNPKVAALLIVHGFSQADLVEGFALLRAVAGMEMAPDAPGEDPQLLARLRAYEKRWFKVARAALERHYPEIARQFFAKLAPFKGAKVTISVAAFVERLEELAKADSSYGPDAAAARVLLERRGLTTERLAEGRSLVNEITDVPAAPVQEVSAAKQKAAEDAMWRWYLEWSQIARASITDRRALRAMGFLRSRNGEDADEQESDETESAAPSALPANGNDAAKSEPAKLGSGERAA
jgi:hypothetical protein